MMERASTRAAAVLLACLALSACNTGGELTDYETRATAEFRQAQERAQSGPPKMTRQQALAEYRKCTRELAGKRTNPCDRWKELAYPPSSHLLNTPPRPPGGGNYVPITDELRDAMHAPVASPRR